MYYDVNPRQPLLTLFSDKELDEIHYASLEILEGVGVNVYHERARELLYSAGARITNDLRVRIPSCLVEKALHLAPKRVVLANRLGKRILFLEGSKVYFGTGSDLLYTIDHETGESRESVLKDVEEAALVADYLENIDFIMSYGLPSDIAPLMQGLYSFYAMMKGSVKPMVLTMSSGRRDMLEYMYEIAIAVAGSPENLRVDPFFIVYNEPVSPLRHTSECMEILLFCSEHRIPVLYPPVVMAGVSGPATMSGCIALGNAEALAGLVVTQLNNPGSPFIHGSGGVSTFDMKYSLFPYGAPEWHMADVVFAQLAQRYDLPAWSIAGCTDSRTIDEQALIEGTYTILLSALAGANLVHDIGYLNSGLTGSLDFLVMMEETIAMTRRILRNFGVSREELAVELIGKIGPGGNFLIEPHTLKHFKGEAWEPNLFNRSNYEDWVKDGKLTLKDRARAEIKRILRSHQPVPLPEEVRKEIEKILHSAEKDVVSKRGKGKHDI